MEVFKQLMAEKAISIETGKGKDIDGALREINLFWDETFKHLFDVCIDWHNHQVELTNMDNSADEGFG